MGNTVRNVNRITGNYIKNIFSNPYPSLALENVLLVLDCVSMGRHSATWLHDKTPESEIGRFIATYEHLTTRSRTSAYSFRINIFCRSNNSLP